MTDRKSRISSREVCALAGYTKATLGRRIDAGRMPPPIDRGGDGYIFNLDAVEQALGIKSNADQQTQAPKQFDPDAYGEALARQLRRGKGAGWRDRPRLLPSPAETEAGGVASGDPVAPEREADRKPLKRR